MTNHLYVCMSSSDRLFWFLWPIINQPFHRLLQSVAAKGRLRRRIRTGKVKQSDVRSSHTGSWQIRSNVLKTSTTSLQRCINGPRLWSGVLAGPRSGFSSDLCCTTLSASCCRSLNFTDQGVLIVPLPAQQLSRIAPSHCKTSIDSQFWFKSAITLGSYGFCRSSIGSEPGQVIRDYLAQEQ